MDEAETRRAPATKPALVPLCFEVMYRFHMLLSYTSGLVPLDLYLEKSTWFWVQSFNPSVQQTAGWILSVCARRPSSAMREVNASPSFSICSLYPVWMPECRVFPQVVEQDTLQAAQR